MYSAERMRRALPNCLWSNTNVTAFFRRKESSNLKEIAPLSLLDRCWKVFAVAEWFRLSFIAWTASLESR